MSPRPTGRVRRSARRAWFGPERDLAVDDRRSERAFGGVVGRLDPLDGHERPERGPDLEQVVGEPAVPTSACALGRGRFQQRSKLGLDLRDLSLEAVAIVMLVLAGAPRGEHPASQLKATLTERFLLAQAVGVLAEVALQVRPA